MPAVTALPAEGTVGSRAARLMGRDLWPFELTARPVSGTRFGLIFSDKPKAESQAHRSKTQTRYCVGIILGDNTKYSCKQFQRGYGEEKNRK